ncbi:hypothetical protein BCR41DRAFT_156000 [Lobosporangium transversale]|uniref:BTB domain-containing protein n=1 Tax=Lobosporangium transversale TaxID=64571 RepID=A0A1Y2H175_9FUNG|nr:hypothetical protein BCR41DRAFT_156000 [Lobosporangium transversale]ORZ27483.1 hypothetical protein BCR41DRAFT_156000 [Lobosporangium transversale]|eukprot:XP_021885210.1 hypothetical protein BCR41DRAFT_156000 [Lobosporangium transversale]
MGQSSLDSSSMTTTHHAPLNNTIRSNVLYSLRANGTSNTMNDDVNRKDSFGISTLHRAVANNNLDLVKQLLGHPKLDVNDKDLESGWTALHRALYLGHLRIALLLIQHKNINMTIEDKDRNTAIDLCQATLPVSLKVGPCPGDALYTWGSNSNFTLGHNDGDDRKQPELVKFPYQTNTITFPRVKSAKPILYQMSMSKFHTAIATSEPGFTAKIWGFGTNGRLGSDRKMQLSPAPVSGIPGNVVSTALGRDHTIFVTAKGEVYTLGSNKYGQLGYALEAPKNGQDPIQYSPKRVVLTITRLKIVGAAASRWHSAVHTDSELFTFGFNFGQLGYERKGDIQLGPRKVASIPPGNIIQVVASDSATACLMSSNEVVVFHKYAYHKVAFSLNPFPDWFTSQVMYSMSTNNHPQKIACSENKFGMMTVWGDIHVWSYPEVDPGITLGSLPPNQFASSIAQPEKPRRVWTCGGERTHAIDFALGQNGSVIMLTKGGHVYIGTNKGSSLGRNVKWQRIPHLDRVVRVYANPSGAWAALRSESALTPVIIRPGRLDSDLEQSLSQFHLYNNNEKNCGTSTEPIVYDDDDGDEASEAEANPWKIDSRGWLDIERSWDYDVVPLLDSTAESCNIGGTTVSGSHLFDVELEAGKRTLGAHRIVLAARSPALCRVFVETPRIATTIGSLVSIEPTKIDYNQRILYTIMLKVEFATAVLLLQFLYSDRFDPFWDALDLPKSIKQYALKVRQELYHLALELSLPTLQAALQYSFTHTCSPSLSKNMAQVILNPIKYQGLADVRLLLKHGESMDLHQMILGHRSPFFNAMFVRTNEWIRARQGPRRLPEGSSTQNDQLLEVNMTHMGLEAMTIVVNYIYTDCGPELFDNTEKDDISELLQLVIDVLQIADELLMDRLKEICENVLGEQVRAKTVVAFLEIALMYSAESLQTTCLNYLCHNIEMVLDQRWLEDVDGDVLELVEKTLKGKQDSFMPFIRSGGHLPDPEKVERVRQQVKLDGYNHFLPRGTYKPDVHHSRQNHDRESEQARIASQVVAHEFAALLPSQSTPIPSQIRSTTSSQVLEDLHTRNMAQRQQQPYALPYGGGVTGWPTLTDSATLDLKDIPQLARRKTNWDHVPTMEGTRLSEDGTETVLSEGLSVKPSFREIQDQEQRQGQNSSIRVISASSPVANPKASKMSQKERRKLLQQQQPLPVLEQPQSSQTASITPVWGKVASTNVTDSVVGGAGGSSMVQRHGISNGPNSGLITNTPSLLDIQQNELSIFRAQSKEIPRVAVATSKPLKETM